MRLGHVSWVLLVVACAPETVPSSETAGTTTSPSGGTSAETSSSTTERQPYRHRRWEGTECVAVWDEPQEGYEDLGVCTLPEP